MHPLLSSGINCHGDDAAMALSVEVAGLLFGLEGESGKKKTVRDQCVYALRTSSFFHFSLLVFVLVQVVIFSERIRCAFWSK